ncbi:MAG: PadR family transcriptional regulator [Myxococcota bacterium]
MALREAILACLTVEPMSGYDLAKYFDNSIGFFWHASHPQIYRELKKLRDEGLVEATEVVQSGKPNRIEYALRRAGRKALRHWSREATSPPPVKDDLLVRLYALDDIDLGALRQQLITRRAHHAERLARYETIQKRHFSGAVEDGVRLGRLLGLELGLRYERGWLEWCEEALERLPTASTESP